MSGVCGRFELDGAPADLEHLAAGMRAMARYGPDGSGTWSDGAVALGHQLHALLPESVGEQQPTRLAGSELVIIADARLDNRDELAEAIGLRAVDTDSWTDARYILAAYEKWGLDCVPRLLGDFAFALWDGGARRLLLARDFLGVRPLYYAHDGRRVAFASDIAGGLAVAGLPTHLEPRALREQLHRGSMQDQELTFFRDLMKLPPAHTLVASADGVRRHRYWRPEDVPDFDPGSEEDTIAQLLDLVTEATRCRTRCTRKVGAHASGGLDSSTLAVLAARILAESDRTLTAINWAPPFTENELPLDPDTDERAVIEALAVQEPNLEPCYTPLTTVDLAEGWGVDQALHPSTTLRWEYRASKEAAARGVGVVLSGWGGDETIAFNGRGFLSDLARRGRWLRLARELHLRSKIHPVVLWGVRTKVIMPLMPDWMFRTLLRKHAERRTRNELPTCLTPELRTALEAIDPRPKSGRERPGRRRMQHVLLDLGHLDHRTESWADNGAAVGIEYRYPVLDRRIVEFALGAPDWLFFNNGWKRYAFRRAMEGLVPPVAQWKKRKGDPALVRGCRDLFAPARKMHRLDVMARENDIRTAGLLDFDAFLHGLDRADPGTDTHGAAGARPDNGSGQASWLAFITGTLG